MKNLIFILEEPSAKKMLEGILPNILPDNITVKYIVFEGKQDLEKQIERRLKGWQLPNSYFLVMRDQDSGDCVKIKNGLLEKVRASGKQDTTLVRIACHELETFYLGDLAAVEKGLELRNLAKKQKSKKFRNPDTIAAPANELSKITGEKYQKVAGSRAIGPHLKIDNSNTSKSFNILLSGIKTLLEIE